MSHVGDTSNPTPTIGVTRSSASQSRAISGSSVVGSPSKKLKFNENGLPIGVNKANSATRLGHLARTNVPICYKEWRDVLGRYKDNLWKTFKEYLDVSETQRAIFMGKVNNAWKKLMVKLRLTFVGDDINKWKDKVPERIKSEDWERFCENEATFNQKELRKRNKLIKENCERKTTHNTGRNGYARVAEKWEEENGRSPTRVELWLYTHKRKDGTYAPHDKEFADKIEVLLKVFQDKGEEETLDSGPLYEVFGKETNRRVCCIGSNISRKAMLASTFARKMLKEVSVVHDDWMEKVNGLKEDIDGLKSTLAQFVEDFKSGKFVNVRYDFHATTSPIVETRTTESPTSVPFACSGTHLPSLDDLIPCNILSYKHEIVGKGRKAMIGAVTSVRGYRLRQREVQVILDKITVPKYPVWGKIVGFASTLEEVCKGGIMVWHDDFLPPIDDTN